MKRILHLVPVKNIIVKSFCCPILTTAVSAAREILRIHFSKSCFFWFPTRYIKNKNCFLKDLHRTTCGHRLEWLGLSVLFHMLFPMIQFESEIDSELKMFSRKILIDSNQQTL